MKAYITLLSTPEYLDGVLILHQSLIETGAKYPLYVGITPNIPPDVREVLMKKKINIIELTSFSYNQKAKKAFSAWGVSHWWYTAAKVRIFGLVQFEKLVYLDSDMLVLKNIDHLFEKEDGTAAEDSPMIYQGKDHRNLNSGIMVITPSKEKEKKLIEFSFNRNVADQDLIRMLYSSWTEKYELHLPIGYNIHAKFIQEYLKKGVYEKDFFVLHFIGSKKPFMENYIKKRTPSKYEQYEELYMETLFRSQKNIKI